MPGEVGCSILVWTLTQVSESEGKYLCTLFIIQYAAPICDTRIDIPENAASVWTKSADYIGQEITITCWEGFEFTDTPTAYTAPEDNTTPLGVMAVTFLILILSLQIRLCMRRGNGKLGNHGLRAIESVGQSPGKDGETARQMALVLEITQRQKAATMRLVVSNFSLIADNCTCTPSAPEWTAWSSWSSCANPYEGDECKTASRSRICEDEDGIPGTPGEDCQGDDSETERCPGCCE